MIKSTESIRPKAIIYLEPLKMLAKLVKVVTEREFFMIFESAKIIGAHRGD